MTMPTDLFRREALEYRSHQQGPGAVLQIGAAWLRWLFRLTLALLVTGLVLVFWVRIDQTTEGPALVDPQQHSFIAALPAIERGDLREGQSVHLELAGPAGTRTVTATTSQVRAAGDADVERAGFRSFPRPAVLVTGVLPPGTTATAASPASRVPGHVVVDLGSQQAFSLFMHGFDGGGG